jgi:hypothetical protein
MMFVALASVLDRSRYEPYKADLLRPAGSNPSQMASTGQEGTSPGGTARRAHPATVRWRCVLFHPAAGTFDRRDIPHAPDGALPECWLITERPSGQAKPTGYSVPDPRHPRLPVLAHQPGLIRRVHHHRGHPGRHNKQMSPSSVRTLRVLTVCARYLPDLAKLRHMSMRSCDDFLRLTTSISPCSRPTGLGVGLATRFSRASQCCAYQPVHVGGTTSCAGFIAARPWVGAIRESW